MSEKSPKRNAAVLKQLQDNHDSMDEVKEYLGKYYYTPTERAETVLGCVGKGAFGSVWLVEQKANSNALVARKKMSTKASSVTGLIGDIKAEIRAMMRLNGHPCFPIFFGWSHDDDFVSIDMEYMRNGSLMTFVQTFHPVPFNILLHIGAQLLIGIEYMGACGLVHSDLGPRNVTLTSDFRTKIIDFGYVTRVGNRSALAPDQPLGSFAPEARYGPMTNKSDVWGWAGLMFYVSCGERAFELDDVESETVRWEKVQRASAFKTLLRSAFQRDPSMRASVADLKGNNLFEKIDWQNVAYMPLPFMAAGRKAVELAKSYASRPVQYMDADEMADFYDELDEAEKDCALEMVYSARCDLHLWEDDGNPDNF